MKKKILEFIIIGFIVLMIGGILTNIKGTSNDDITNMVSNFEQQDQYEASGYLSNYVDDEDNTNGFGKFNSQLGEFVADGINKFIDLIFDFMKKIIS